MQRKVCVGRYAWMEDVCERRDIMGIGGWASCGEEASCGCDEGHLVAVRDVFIRCGCMQMTGRTGGRLWLYREQSRGWSVLRETSRNGRREAVNGGTGS